MRDGNVFADRPAGPAGLNAGHASLPIGKNTAVRVRRNTDNGYEVVQGRLPLLMTVVDSANEPRPPAAKRVMKYKRAQSRLEIEAQFRKQNPSTSDDQVLTHVDRRAEELAAKGLLIDVWNLDDIKADLAWCGRDGSPTKVKRIQAIILKASGFKKIEPTDEGVSGLIHELIEDHTIG
jgi:electron transfer flavoprotein beta subunit